MTKIIKYEPREGAIVRFKERFKDYLNGKEEYLDNIRDRWTNAEIIFIYEWAYQKGKKLRRKR